MTRKNFELCHSISCRFLMTLQVLQLCHFREQPWHTWNAFICTTRSWIIIRKTFCKFTSRVNYVVKFCSLRRLCTALISVCVSGTRVFTLLVKWKNSMCQFYSLWQIATEIEKKRPTSFCHTNCCWCMSWIITWPFTIHSAHWKVSWLT